MKATVKLEHNLIAVEGERDVHAMLEIAPPERADGKTRPPLSLALVVDRSGSMQGPKLAYAKRSAEWLIGRLHADDRIALVDYDDQVRLLAPIGHVDPQALRAALNAIQPGGMTNLSGGWLKGAEQLRSDNGTRKILLLTDGLANEGITDPAALVQLATGARGEGIGTTTIGFGDGFNEDLLTAMADAGGGNAHYAASADAAPAIFAAEFDDLTRLWAQNLSLEIRPSGAVSVLGVLNEYPSVAVSGGIQVELGDAYEGERRRVVFRLQVPALQELGVAKVADLVLRYVSVDDGIEQHELTIPVAVNLVSASEAAAAAPDLEVREEVLVLAAAQARDEAIRLADEGRFDDAQAVLHDTAEKLRASGMTSLEPEANALDLELPVMAPASYGGDPSVRKRLHYDSRRRRRGKPPS